MKLSAPKGIIWWIALIIAVLAILSYLNIIPVAFIKNNAFWAMAVAYVLLFLGTLFKGL